VTDFGMPDLQGLLAQAEQMQSQLAAAQAELEHAEVTGTSGSGLVTARVTGTGELVGLTIDPRLFEGAEPAETAEVLADLVIAAVRNANHAAEELREQAMSPITGAFDALTDAADDRGLPGV
jgi:DNA-binding YbaB/EbfC family protein